MLHSKFIGLNNKLPATRLQTEAGLFLRHAFNVDVADSQLLRRRDGYSQISAVTNSHSMFSNGVRTLLVRDSLLVEITSFSPATFVTLTGLASTATMSYYDVGGGIYFTNGTDSGFLPAGSQSPLPWGIETPSAPILSETSGNLSPGRYLVALTYGNAAGRESGASSQVAIELVLPASGVHVLLPAGAVGATVVNVYLSAAGGELATWNQQVATGTLSVVCSDLSTGRTLQNRFLSPMPAGIAVSEYHGRLLVATGSVLAYSAPRNYGMHDPSRDFVQFHGNISNVVPTTGGVFVVADKTYWLAGPDIAEAEMRVVLPHAGTPGTAVRLPDNMTVGWYSDAGWVIGAPTGEAKPVQEETLMTDIATAGTALVRDHLGDTRVIVSLYGTVTPPVGVDPQIAAEEANRLFGV